MNEFLGPSTFEGLEAKRHREDDRSRRKVSETVRAASTAAGSREFVHGSEPRILWIDDLVKGILRDLYDADLVVAVLADHNANVWYELGIRYALRIGTVMLIEEGHRIPFDISATEFSAGAFMYSQIVLDKAYIGWHSRSGSKWFRFLPQGLPIGKKCGCKTALATNDDYIFCITMFCGSGVIEATGFDKLIVDDDEFIVRDVMRIIEPDGNALICEDIGRTIPGSGIGLVQNQCDGDTSFVGCQQRHGNRLAAEAITGKSDRVTRFSNGFDDQFSCASIRRVRHLEGGFR